MVMMTTGKAFIHQTNEHTNKNQAPRRCTTVAAKKIQEKEDGVLSFHQQINSNQRTRWWCNMHTSSAFLLRSLSSEKIHRNGWGHLLYFWASELSIQDIQRIVEEGWLAFYSTIPTRLALKQYGSRSPPFWVSLRLVPFFSSPFYVIHRSVILWISPKVVTIPRHLWCGPLWIQIRVAVDVDDTTFFWNFFFSDLHSLHRC